MNHVASLLAFASSIASQCQGWAVVGIAAGCGFALLSGCSKQYPTNPKNAATNVRAGSHATIEQPLADKDISVSFAPSIKQLQTVTKTIRVRYRNESGNRGYFDLPKALRPLENFKGLVVAVGMRNADGDEPVFVFYEDDGKEHDPGAIAVLDPGALVVVDYPAENFCMIGHGIAPDAAANLTTCYRAGDDATEMRIYLITDLDKMTRTASEPLTVKLSKPDFSMHRDLNQSKNRKPKAANP